MLPFQNSSSTPHHQQDLIIHRVEPDRCHEALVVLFTGRQQPSTSAACDQADFADELNYSPEQLWAAYREGQPIAAALIAPVPGRTAMGFFSPVWHRSEVYTLASLAQAVCSSLDHQAIHLVQTLLNPSQRLESQALLSAGFIQLANLRYMYRGLDAIPDSRELDPTLQLLTWHPSRRTLFSQAILDSYQNTLDCPRLLGLRQIDDIIAGHMAIGDFNPDLWFVLTLHDQPIAVLLLSPSSHRRVMELVYLGISPDWRGRGLGSSLLSLALLKAKQHSHTKISLAVDEANTPALRLYQHCGFQSRIRKSVLIWVPPENKKT